MPAFITLASFTEQGARNIKESPARYEAFKSAAEAAGVTVKSVHWTTGAFDLVIVAEGSEDAVMTLALKTAALGNVRTQTMRAFSVAEMRKLVADLK
ncbi:MAG: GYD domain-containing protein [Burkholderiaceae bacterium]|nr:MAG: GYD domain-containing protein [Burkholderiaceae bacterium]MBE7424745.1 GYD domain-containing protein [Ideonella sp.]MCC7285055.1 GYD domain-containing protein [Burkholderiaceae bacterium]